uniref:Putative ribonuclease H-like domain-containing protein n=1 Tax=Tanacetum cinerariifolium TaxID=118510 RepID=A0A6L2KRA8_TANCI|nr:putative ribonuclease H-like domain-containing protein [Tanacetum cinerariifolium]
MHKAFPLPEESSHWQYKFPLPVEGVLTAKRMEIPLLGVCTAMMKKLPGNPQQALKDKGVIDSGCSRHMTGNISFLLEFEKIAEGYVAFGGNPKGGNISGKGKIKTGKLDFDDVYFVKELKFNLFSVSQIYDKKNSVLFIDTECVVLSSDFKLPDENHVLLRVPRENKMYNVDLKNVVPLGGLTCLFTKATLDESNLWHKRLVHINFKTMNKLVKQGFLVGYLVSRMIFMDYGSWNRTDRTKARLVALRHTQEEAIDYDEVFAPIAMIEAIQLFLAYASFMGFMVYQMDIKIAFLYGTIKEEVYVCQPLRFEDPNYPDKVYKVVKALYGLHQAPKVWYKTLANYLLENGFQRGKIDQTLFIKKQKGDILLV